MRSHTECLMLYAFPQRRESCPAVFVRPIQLKLDPHFMSRKYITSSLEQTGQMMCSLTGMSNLFSVMLCYSSNIEIVYTVR